MKKIAIDKGHNRGADQGAVGIGNENVMNIEVGDKVIVKLKALGYDVLDVISEIPDNVSVGESLNMRVNIANRWGADIYAAIHHNCGGGHGVEVWIGSDSSRDKAQSIVNNIAVLGFTNRGVKVQGQDGNEHLYVLNNTSMPALLTEGCFVDSQEDMNRYNAESMANAIVKGIVGTTISVTTSKVNVVSAPQNNNVSTSDINTFVFLQHEFNVQLGAGISEDNIPGPITLSKCPLIKQGSQGNITKWVQNKLNKLGFSCGAADGVFGNMTATAVRTFQRAMGLVDDGIIGSITWNALLKK